MLVGEYLHTLDDKGRLAIPAKFRAELAGRVFISKGIENCLWLHPEGAWGVLAAKIIAVPRTDPAGRELRRQVFGSAAEAEPDKQGRINLPEYLLRFSHIDKQAVVIGQYDYCEIWNPEEWRLRQVRTESDPEERAKLFATIAL
jgi:MraZ protein